MSNAKNPSKAPILPIDGLLEQSSAARKSAFDWFGDGYDIEAERVVCKHLTEADDPDSQDPLYQRWLELEERETRLRQIQSTNRLRQKADPLVTDGEAMKIGRVGGLVSDSDDVMELHTRDSYKLFVGRARGDKERAIVAGKRVAAALRAIYLLSGNDNPYADWLLINTEKAFISVRDSLAQKASEGMAVFDQLAQQGIKISILKSREPVQVPLGFQSPYGFSLAMLISDVDRYSRVLKTLMAKDQLTKLEGDQQMYDVALRPARSIFERLIPQQRALMAEEMVKLSRSDWASDDAEARKRIRVAVECFGECPRDIFTGKLAPRHSRRKGAPTKQELQYLNEVPLTGFEDGQFIGGLV
jgi:integrating conjugative element protein (TIGR03761 family)